MIIIIIILIIITILIIINIIIIIVINITHFDLHICPRYLPLLWVKLQTVLLKGHI